MAYSLGDHVSYCQVDAHIIFLDLRADRYSCLDPQSSLRFTRWIADGAVAHPATAGLATLEDRNLLVVRERGERLKPCVWPTPLTSIYDGDQEPADAGETIAAARSLLIAAGLLRLRPLLNNIVRVTAMNGMETQSADETQLRSIVSAHRRLSLLTSEHGSCLLRSSALASRLKARSIAFNFVFGVRLGGFAAHCWLERDGLILNDTHEHVTAFMPILVK